MIFGKTIMLAGLAAVLVLTSSCGKNTNAEALGQEDISTNEQAIDFSQNNFVLQNDVRVMTSSDLDGEKDLKEQVLPAGLELSIIESKVSANGEEVIHVGIDSNEGSDLPSDLWIRKNDDLQKSLLTFEAPADDGQVGTDSEASGDASIFRRMTYCYRYVKLYLLKIGKVKSYLPGGSAYMAYRTLPKYGFRLTGHTPRTARNGEVCVYSGGPAGHGHIEVKRNGMWWYGYGFKSSPIQNRRFMGCFNK